MKLLEKILVGSCLSCPYCTHPLATASLFYTQYSSKNVIFQMRPSLTQNTTLVKKNLSLMLVLIRTQRYNVREFAPVT